MRKFAGLLLTLLFAFSIAPAWAGSEERPVTTETTSRALAPVPLNIFETESSYVFESDIDNGRKGLGKGDAFSNSFEYGHRFLLSGNLYLHLGLAYDRFDFGHTAGPLPDHLQSFAGVIGIDYMHGEDVGAFLSVRPGFYTQDKIGINSFDAVITGGRIFVLQPDKLYLFVGANASFLRGRLPVLPLIGVVWEPCPQWKIVGLLPEPRVIYSPTKNIDLWAGGELQGGSFRTERDDRFAARNLNHAEVDYSEYRAGGGLVYSPADHVSMDLGGGYAFERQFDFSRAHKRFTADPAPYLRLEFKAKF